MNLYRRYILPKIVREREGMHRFRLPFTRPVMPLAGVEHLDNVFSNAMERCSQDRRIADSLTLRFNQRKLTWDHNDPRERYCVSSQDCATQCVLRDVVTRTKRLSEK